jgi:hypothetical protein
MMVNAKDTYKYLSGDSSMPAKSEFKPGTYMVDSDDDYYSYVSVLMMLDPNKIDYTEKWESEEIVLQMPSTQQYIQWYKEGHMPPPITVVFNTTQEKYLSTNRRRLLAAREAGMKQIPVWVEIGKYNEVVEASKK